MTRDPHHVPDPKPRERGNTDIERDSGRDSGIDERVPRHEGDTSRTVGPEDEDRRVRPGEKRPHGTMP